jgi:hypothetical protein
VSTTPVANGKNLQSEKFLIILFGHDTGGKFATGVNNTRGTGGKLPPVSTTPAANQSEKF